MHLPLNQTLAAANHTLSSIIMIVQPHEVQQALHYLVVIVGLLGTIVGFIILYECFSVIAALRPRGRY